MIVVRHFFIAPLQRQQGLESGIRVQVPNVRFGASRKGVAVTTLLFFHVLIATPMDSIFQDPDLNPFLNRPGCDWVVHCMFELLDEFMQTPRWQEVGSRSQIAYMGAIGFAAGRLIACNEGFCQE